MSSLAIWVHIAAGTIGLGAGFAALTLTKGSRAHRNAGSAFVGAMVVMAMLGFAMAAAKPDRITATTGLFTAYLVLSGWAAARRTPAAPASLAWQPIAGIAIAAVYLAWGLIGITSSDGRIDRLPGTIALVFFAVAALAACGDIRAARNPGYALRRRIARHSWRMSAALFIAAMSFFVGQQKVMPANWRGSPLLLLPEIAVLLSMIYWGVKLRVRRAEPAPLLQESAT